MGNARDTGYLQNIVTYDANDNIVLPADLSIAGNLGLGVTPSNSYAGSVSFEIGANGILWSEQASSIYNSMSIGSNFYYNSAGSLLYKNTGVASSRYIQYQGSHFWYSAPSGTAGNAISFTEAMTLNASGNLLVGTTTDNGAKLQVSGAATFSSSVTASGNASTTPSFIANNSSSAGGTAQHYIDFTAGATVISRMSRGNGASGLAGNGLNIDNFDGFGVRLNQLGGSGGTFSVTGGAATFSSSVTATNLNLTDGGGAAINNVNGNLFIQTGAGTGWIFRNGPSGYAEYMRLTPTGSLGIGTTSPQQKLEVNGKIALTADVSRRVLEVDGSNNLLVGGGFNTIYMNGNVGIGTSSPASKLDVSTGVDSDAGLIGISIGGTVANSRQALIEKQTSGTRTLGIYSSLSASVFEPISFYTGVGTAKLSILEGGEVLVGGDIELNTSVTVTDLTIQGTGRGQLNLFRNDTSIAATNTFGIIGFWGNDTASNIPVMHASIEAVASETHGSTSNPTDLIFKTTPSASVTRAEAMRITSSGNVGIGTTSPGQLLTLGGTASPQLSIVSSTTTGSSEIYFGDSAAVYRGAILYDHTSDYLTLHAGTGERMRITSSGNVLIGTTTDSGYKLDVQQGATNAAKFNFAVTGAWGGGANQDHGMLISGARYPSDTNTSLLHIINTDNTSLFRVTDYGKVGIGTDSPSAELEILKSQSTGPVLKLTNPETNNTSQDLGVLGFVSGDLSTGQANLIRASVKGIAGELSYGTGGQLVFSTMQTYAGSGTLTDLIERMRIDSTGVVRITNLTSNGLIGTDSSGNLRTVVSEYTEIATGTISYSNNSGASWGINNSFPATIRNYDDDGMAGSAGVGTSLNLGRGVTFDLGSAKAVRRIVERGYPTKNLNIIIVQYSTDNSNWTDIYVYNHVYGNTQKTMEFNPTGAISARYWRWFIHSWSEREVQNYYTYESIIYT